MKNQPDIEGAYSTDCAPFTDLTNTGGNQHRPEQKQHSGQRWYARMSADKMAEYLETLGVGQTFLASQLLLRKTCIQYH